MLTFHRRSVALTRPELYLEATPLGNDWQLTLWGGRPHIGALVLAEPGQPARCLAPPRHRESEISCELAELCARTLRCNIAFCCGIHYDHITRDEIDEVLLLARSLVNEFLARVVGVQS